VNAAIALRESAAGISVSTAVGGSQPALRDCVVQAVRRYLRDLGGHPVEDLHQLVMREVEGPLFAEVLRHYDGNQSRAAAALGINRSTLRKKLKEYKLG
jgi:Fis family transcriptional regulator